MILGQVTSAKLSMPEQKVILQEYISILSTKIGTGS